MEPLQSALTCLSDEKEAPVDPEEQSSVYSDQNHKRTPQGLDGVDEQTGRWTFLHEAM